jgi:hypothetical protein
MSRNFQNNTMRSQSVSNLINPTSNAGIPQQAAMYPQQQMQPGNKNLPEKLFEIMPQYVLQRIFANINEIYRLVMEGGWHEPQFKMLIENEIQNLTKNLEDPSLKAAINELTKAADVPLSLFVKNFTVIIDKHIKDITNKITNMAINIVGEIPGVNVVTNAVLAASNAVHVAKNVTELGKELVESVQTFKNEMTTVMEKFNPQMNPQFGPQMMSQAAQSIGQMPFSPQVAQSIGQMPFSPQAAQSIGQMPFSPQAAQSIGQQFGQLPFGQQRQRGGSKSYALHNMKDATKHLHHLQRKKNRTLRRIHHSIHQFLTSSRNKRSIKAKTKR